MAKVGEEHEMASTSEVKSLMIDATSKIVQDLENLVSMWQERNNGLEQHQETERRNQVISLEGTSRYSNI